MDPVLDSALHGLSAASMLLNQMDAPFSFPLAIAIEKEKDTPKQAFHRQRQIMAGSPIDVMESPTSYVFQADMPGLKSSDVEVQIEDKNILSIKGNRKTTQEGEDRKYIRSERKPFNYHRKLLLPEDAEIDSVKAACSDGVLTVTLQKIPPPEPKKPKIVTVPVN